MKTKQQLPDRYWVGQPDAHPNLLYCGMCHQALDRSNSIPVLTDAEGACPLCFSCATEEIGLLGTPQTVEYAKWLTEGDPRWWSKFLCTCLACYARIQQGGKHDPGAS